MIFIPFNVPSLKNSKTISMINKRPVLVHSKTVKKYLQKIGVKKYRVSVNKKQVEKGYKKVEGYVNRPNIFRESCGNYFDNIEYPAIIGMHFVRDSKRDFDFNNASQIIADLLTAHEFIIDDNMRFFIPYPIKINDLWYSINTKNPGVYIKILANQSK